jgi:hypothetical protein
VCKYLGVKPQCAMKVNDNLFIFGRKDIIVWHYRPIMNPRGERFEYEHICWYPKDGELCLNRVKPGETLVEARSDSDVQIDRQIWV